MPRKDNKHNIAKRPSYINTLFRRTAQGRSAKPMSCEKGIYATPILQKSCLWGSCLLLLFLTFLIVNPVNSSSAFAEEDAGDNYTAASSDNYSAISFTGSDDTNGDDADGVASLSAITSTVNISFSPSAGSASISPTNSAGSSAQIKVLATVSVQNSGGYSVYVKGNSQNLVGQSNSNNTIPGVTGSVTYANLPVNTWGYTAVNGAAISDSATYKTISTSGNGEKVAENTGKEIKSDTKTIALGFVAKANDAIPADTYKNTVTLSVISSPMQVTFASQGVTTMQGMTTAICNAVDIGQEAQLKDTRDNKFYWVGKLADGKCWMTQNLDLDLSTATTLTNANTDLQGTVTSYKPAYNTATAASADTILADDTGQRSWSLGNYRITNPTASSDCGTKKADIAACATASTANDRFTPYTTPTTANGDANAHYIVGNHYQWNAATAGTGGSITSGQASSSICPKGWKLPESNASAAGTFQGLINAGSIGSDVAKLTSSPYYFVRGGYVYQDSDYFSYAGDRGVYWSSTPHSNGTSAYSLYFDGTSRIGPSYGYSRRYGYSVRCLAR